jgi:hypothetical protein
MLMIRTDRFRGRALVSALALLTALLCGSVFAQAQSLTAADIVREIDARGGIAGIGSQIAFLSFTIQDKNGSVQESSFVSFGKTSADPGVADSALIYFLAPPAETCGTVFLTVDRKVSGQATELYLYLPALGQTKQLVSSGERTGSFAGSNIQFDQMGRSELSSKFDAELLGETTLTVSVDGVPQDRRVYVLHLVANAQTNPSESFPERTMWVDAEQFLVLASESRNTVGKLQSVLRADALVTFRDRLEYAVMTVSNVLDSSWTTVRVADREDVGELADSLFDPALLPQFDPRQFNDRLQVQVPDPICP